MNKTIKQSLHQACVRKVEERIRAAQQSMEAAQVAANQETKSSAGDKYETGRAMMQQEQEKATSQLMEALKLKKVLDQLNPAKNYEKVQPGCLVWTDKGNFYIAASIGQLFLDGQEWMVISPVAPLARQLNGLAAGTELTFNGRIYQLKAVG
jgi:transcription elongation GreA/GreB family factor